MAMRKPILSIEVDLHVSDDLFPTNFKTSFLKIRSLILIPASAIENAHSFSGNSSDLHATEVTPKPDFLEDLFRNREGPKAPVSLQSAIIYSRLDAQTNQTTVNSHK